MKLIFYYLLCCFSFALAALRPDQVVVVYNENSPLSVECAQLYAKIRQIPKRHLLPLDVPVDKASVSSSFYESSIRDPLRLLMDKGRLHLPGSGKPKAIKVLLLMPDLPFKITPSLGSVLEWKMTDAASVDSELSLLCLEQYEKKGLRVNPYFKKKESLSGASYPILSVCRIDSPSAEISRRMIERPIEVEKRGGLKGVTLVDSGGPYAKGDKWMAEIVSQSRAAGISTIVHEAPSTIAESYSMPQDLAFYFGWYSTIPCGPFDASASPKSCFLPGSVAVHIYSFSAVALSDAKLSWVAALLSKGADVTAGNVWEPYLSQTLHLSIFYDRLRAGYCVAEAAAMATPSFSWQGLILGDPLYRPYYKEKPSR